VLDTSSAQLNGAFELMKSAEFSRLLAQLSSAQLSSSSQLKLKLTPMSCQLSSMSNSL
jgi:hypothetical protein